MRPFLAVLLSILLGVSGLTQTVPTSDRIPLATGVEIELLESLSSESLHAGQAVHFKLVKDLETNGEKWLAAGTPLSATVTNANPAGHWGKAGAFGLQLDPLKLADGTEVRLDFHRPTRENTRGEKTGEAIGTTLMLTYYFPLIPVALLSGSRKGKPFKIRAGERYLVYVVGVEDAPAATDSSKQ